MKEEEILRKAKDFILFMDDVIENHLDYDYEENKTAYEDKELVQGLLDLYEKEKEKNKLTGNDIENFKREAYMLGKADENKAMIGVIQRHYIRKDKIREKIKQLEKEQEENRRNLSLGIELLSNTIIDKFSNKIMINLGIRDYLENIIN